MLIFSFDALKTSGRTRNSELEHKYKNIFIGYLVLAFEAEKGQRPFAWIQLENSPEEADL